VKKGLTRRRTIARRLPRSEVKNGLDPPQDHRAAVGQGRENGEAAGYPGAKNREAATRLPRSKKACAARTQGVARLPSTAKACDAYPVVKTARRLPTSKMFSKNPRAAPY
jgi:hypothetical protein